jgi:hypothetical protein
MKYSEESCIKTLNKKRLPFKMLDFYQFVSYQNAFVLIKNTIEYLTLLMQS